MHLLAIDHQENHILFLLGVHTPCLDKSSAAFQILQNECPEFFVFIADDEQQLVVRRTVDHPGYDPRTDEDRNERIECQHPARTRTIARTKTETDHHQARKDHHAIRQEDTRGKLDARILLKQHGDNVRTARGSLCPHDHTLPHADNDRTDDTGQQQIVRQVERTAQQ